jgi:hypothetical protein
MSIFILIFILIFKIYVNIGLRMFLKLSENNIHFSVYYTDYGYINNQKLALIHIINNKVGKISFFYHFYYIKGFKIRSV